MKAAPPILLLRVELEGLPVSIVLASNAEDPVTIVLDVGPAL